MSCQCYIVPPQILQAIADSSENSDHQRHRARAALNHRNRVTERRERRIAANTAPGARSHPQPTPGIVPQQLLQTLSESNDVDQATRDRAKRDLAFAQSQQQSGDQEPVEDDPKDAPYRAVYNAANTEDESTLPGQTLRAEGQAACNDKAANEAYSNCGLVLKFYKEIFSWDSIDNKHMDVISSVHFGNEYENACKYSCRFVSFL